MIIYFTEINPEELFEETKKYYIMQFDSILSSHLDTLFNDFSLYLTEVSFSRSKLTEIEKQLKGIKSSPDKMLAKQSLDHNHSKISKEIDDSLNRMKNDIQSFVKDFQPYKNLLDDLPDNRKEEHIRKVVDMKDESLSVTLFQLALLFT